MAGEGYYPAPSPFRTGLACRCPRCGRGRLFAGLFRLAAVCPVCGLDYGKTDPGDGPAAIVILLLGAIVALLAVLTELWFEPSLWLHAVLWPPIILGGAVLMLRPMKATLIALQFRHRSGEAHD
ncbi:MAG: DUF983 domain-containing protein [Dongiaceae bacterium]